MSSDRRARCGAAPRVPAPRRPGAQIRLSQASSWCFRSMSSTNCGTTFRNLPVSAGTISIIRSIISAGSSRPSGVPRRLSKAARAELAVEIGDEVTATIELDAAERVVEVPPDLAAALDADPPLRSAFEALSFTHRKEHVRAITEAKRPETRARRVAATLDLLRR